MKTRLARKRGRDAEREADGEGDERAPGEVGPAGSRARRQTPASGPNSGPTTIAPTIRIGESSTMPTAAICIAATMNSTKLTRARCSRRCAPRPPPRRRRPTGAPARPSPRRRRRPRARCRRARRRWSPRAGCSSSLRSPIDHAGVLLGDVAEDHVAVRLAWRRPWRWTMLRTAGEAVQEPRAPCGPAPPGPRCRRWITPRSAPCRLRTSSGICFFSSVTGSMNTWRSSPSASTAPSATRSRRRA